MKIGITLLLLLGLLAMGAWMLGLFDSQNNDQGTKPDVGGVHSRTEEGVNSGTGPNSVPEVDTNPFTPNEESPDPSEVGVPVETGQAESLVGIVHSESQPIPNARVVLHRDNSTTPSITQLGVVLEEALTDEEGRFTFEDIPVTGLVSLRVKHPKYQHRTVRGITRDRPKSLRQSIGLVPGFALSGTVTHKDGFPLEGVEVVAYDMNIQAFEPEDQQERSAKTDADGKWVMNGMSAGIKQLVARHPDLMTGMLSAAPYSEAKDGLDFVLTEGQRISGIVRDRVSGAGVPKAIVMARGKSAGSKMTRVHQAVADGEGRFDLTGLGPGTYELWSRRIGYLMGPREVVRAPDNSVNLTLVPGAKVGGRVVAKGSGIAVTGGVVTLTSNPKIVIPNQSTSSPLDPESGAFLIDGAPEGTYHLVVRPEGYAETVFGPVTLSAGVDHTGLIIEVDEGSMLEGLVLTDANEPVAGASVLVTRSVTPGPNDAAAVFMAPLLKAAGLKLRTKTDENGQYSVRGLAPGGWTVDVKHDEYASLKDVAFSVSEGEKLVKAPNFVMVQCGVVVGTVFTDDEPDTRAAVGILKPGTGNPFKQVETDSEGNYRITGVAPGTYYLRVTKRRGAMDLSGILLANRNLEANEVIVYRDQETRFDLK